MGEKYSLMENRPIRVLLVEDDAEDYLILRDYLSQAARERYRIDWAGNYAAGQEQMAQNRHDLYLIDYHLGNQDGLELLQDAAARGVRAPMILLTGQGGYDIDLQAMQAGAADYLVKSELNPGLLERAIRYALENRRSEALAQRRLNFTRALNEIDSAILSTRDLRTALNVALRQTVEQLDMDAAAVLLLIPETQILEFSAGYGFNTPMIADLRLHLNESIAGRAALEQHIIAAVSPSEEEGFLRSDLLKAEGFGIYYGAPLIAKGEIKGVLEVFSRREIPEPDAEWLGFLATLAGQIAIAVENYELFMSLARSNDNLVLAYDTTLEGWSSALDLRDQDTEGHTQRVTQLTMRLAREVGVAPSALADIRRGALLHDIGKMGIPDKILLKPGPLSDEEWARMREHPTLAFRFLAPIAYLHNAMDIPYCHHERWDGSGYPRGLRGAEIPLAARIFAVADVYDALTSDRPYRSAWEPAKALAYIRKESGRQFDPDIVRAFTKMMRREVDPPASEGG